MTTPVRGDDPRAYLAGDRRRALAGGGPSVDGVVTGAALFADISGFTPLTQALADELGEHRGAEELSVVLDRIVGGVLVELHARGGHAISFSGDAVTCWLQDDDGRAAVACALAMQRVMSSLAEVRTPGGTSVVLAMKVAVVTGEARRFVVGDPDVQLLDVLAGGLLDDLAAAEQQARPGEVVVDDSVLTALGPDLVVGESRDGARGPVHVVAALHLPDPVEPDPGAHDPLGLEPLDEATVRQWLLPPVWERLRDGHGALLTELRPAVPVFVRLGGLDFDADPSAAHELDTFVRLAQGVVLEHGGSTLQLTVGDKGAYLYVVFGSPLAHEDDAARACAAALGLLALESRTRVRDLQVGVASGRLRSGTYGHPTRRTFCCLGDAVNLAARLMAKAPAGQAWVSAEVQARAGGVRTEDLPLLQLKGKRPVRAARLLGLAPRTPRRAEDGPLVGRDDELALLRSEVEGARTGTGRLVALLGAPGTGKTRLVEELVRSAERDGVRVLRGEAPSFGSSAGYGAWRDVVADLLEVPPDAEPEVLAESLGPDRLPLLPLVGTLLGAPLPESPFTRALTPELRKAAAEQLVVSLLGQVTAPALLVLDDAHALDPLSRDLLAAVSAASRRRAVTVVLVGRPDPELVPAALGHLPVRSLDLGPLSPEATAALARTRAAAVAGAPGALSERLVQRVAARSEGNALYCCELVRFLADRGAQGSELDDSDLPDTLQSLVLSRVDGLPEAPRRAAKVASAAGRVFAPLLLRRGYPELGDEEQVRAGLVGLALAGVADVDDPQVPTWAFASGVVRDVAYESLPFALRTLLHTRLAAALEAGVLGDPERHLEALAAHAWRGDDDDRKRRWLVAAGVAAQSTYANEAAMLWFRRVLPLLPPAEQPAVLVRTGRLLELGAAWGEAEQVYAQAEELAASLGDAAGAAWATTWSAEVARKQGRYEVAAERFARAAAGFVGTTEQEAGTAQVQHLSGTLAAQQGQVELARERYAASLALRRALGDLRGTASVLSNLAVVAEGLEELDEAEELTRQALALRVEAEDGWGTGVSLNNLGFLELQRGEVATARDRFEESMQLHVQAGDAEGVVLVHHNLAIASRELGDLPAAREHFAAALQGCREHADDWALSMLLEDVALLALLLGRPAEALTLVGASDALHDALGSPRPASTQDRLDRALARQDGLVDDAGDVRLLRGRALTPEEVDALVASVVTVPQPPRLVTTALADHHM